MALSFSRLAQLCANASGRPWAFVASVVIVLGWGISGPLFGFSDTWQLVLNTGTSIVTFVMVFLMQNAQDRHTQTIQIKLDELIRATEGARDRLIALEDRSDEELMLLRRDNAQAGESEAAPAYQQK